MRAVGDKWPVGGRRSWWEAAGKVQPAGVNEEVDGRGGITWMARNFELGGWSEWRDVARATRLE